MKQTFEKIDENIKIEKVSELDMSKLYLFHIKEATFEECDLFLNQLIKIGFSKETLVVNNDNLDIYEIKNEKR